VERGTILEPLLLGKKAQNIVLADTTLKRYYNLYNLPNKYVVLCFWDPDCGHCKKEVPVLLEAYHNLKKKGVDVEVFAPAIMGKEKLDEWTKFIREKGLDWINVADPFRQNNYRYEWDIQSTPQIYILDKNKIIKAKRIGAEQVEDFILHEEDPNHKPKKPFVEDEDQKTYEPRE
jgi:thiol-disulfide isomerase/thioredoxin